MLSFCIILYIVTGMFLFFIEMKALESLGILNILVNECMQELEKVIEIKEEDRNVAWWAIFTMLSIAYILLWPAFLFFNK